jgi:hypothetical protein
MGQFVWMKRIFNRKNSFYGQIRFLAFKYPKERAGEASAEIVG